MFIHPAEPFAERPPYRPFLAGPPRFAVALSPIPAELWLAPDPEAEAGIANTERVLAGCYDEAVRVDEASGPAQAEARAAIEAALDRAAPETGEADLARAARLVSDDLVVMERRSGDWRATALVLCAPTFFSAADAFGRDLSALHGPVPGGAPGLSGRIGRVFDALPDGAVLQRFNWTLQCGPDRFTPDGAPLRARAAELGSERAAEALHLRVERQTVRRLPKTGGVLFTIRVCLDRLGDLDGEALGGIAAAWRGGSDEARRYKHWAALDAAAEIAFGGCAPS